MNRTLTAVKELFDMQKREQGVPKGKPSAKYYIEPEKLGEPIVQIHDINMHYVFDFQVKKKFQWNQDFIVHDLLQDVQDKSDYDAAKEQRRQTGEVFLEDIALSCVKDLAFLKR